MPETIETCDNCGKYLWDRRVRMDQQLLCDECKNSPMPTNQSPVGSTPPPTPEEKGKTLEEMFEGIRKSCHETYNGGWNDEETGKAFHHGMDTAFNVVMESLAILVPDHSKHYARIEGEKEELVEALQTMMDVHLGVPVWGMDDKLSKIEALIAKHTTSSPTGKV